MTRLNYGKYQDIVLMVIRELHVLRFGLTVKTGRPKGFLNVTIVKILKAKLVLKKHVQGAIIFEHI